jgi:hypothetical protein
MRFDRHCDKIFARIYHLHRKADATKSRDARLESKLRGRIIW